MNKYQHQIEIYRTEYPLKSTVLINPITSMLCDEFGNEDKWSKLSNEITVSNFYASLKYAYEKEQREITDKINQKDAELRESLIKEKMKKETPKFITPVSMEVTEEQYNKDLKKPLEEMGYVSTYLSHIRERRDCLCSNVDEINNSIEFLNNSFKTGSKRHFIEEYNPELFLALAAMTSGEDCIVGEYFKTHIDGVLKVLRIDKGKMYQGRKRYHLGPDMHGINRYYNHGFATKATKEEIINHFKSLSQESVLEDTIKEVNEETSFQKEAEKHSFIGIQKMMKNFEAKQRGNPHPMDCVTVEILKVVFEFMGIEASEATVDKVIDCVELVITADGNPWLTQMIDLRNQMNENIEK